ncbi:MAG: universal stress protein [Alphaproteobacteria bacterium]|nr:universal stress protein [Alphaproteobacteria bacterium]
MPIKSILTLITGEEADLPTLQHAVQQAKNHQAQLQILHVKPDTRDMLPIIGDGMSGLAIEQMITSVLQSADERAKKAKATADKIIAEQSKGMQITFQLIQGSEANVWALAGRFADLIIFSRPGSNNAIMANGGVDAILFETGHPTLMIPPVKRDVTKQDITSQPVIAWNGSAQAARAVSWSLPFLQKSTMVTILNGTTNAEIGPARLSKWLAAHGIKTTVKNFDQGSRTIGSALLEEAGLVGGTMIVMGAYGHSRLRQFILGGATRELLQTASLPILLAH